MGFPYSPLTWKEYNRRNTGSNPLYPSSYKPPYFSYLLHNSMSKEQFGEASKCRNKKQEARRKKKIEQEKLEGKSLDIGDGGLEAVPPPSQENIRKLCFWLVRHNSRVTIFYRIQRKESKIFSASSMHYRVKKKSKILKNCSFLKSGELKGHPKKSLLLIFKIS